MAGDPSTQGVEPVIFAAQQVFLLRDHTQYMKKCEFVIKVPKHWRVTFDLSAPLLPFWVVHKNWELNRGVFVKMREFNRVTWLPTDRINKFHFDVLTTVNT